MTFDQFIDIALFAFLAATAIAMLRANSLFAAAMLSGIFSLLCAGLYTVMDAVDVAFTEAAVGAGISTVLFLGTLALTSSRAKPQRTIHWPAMFMVLVTGSVLIWSTLDMPLYGDPSAPIHHHVADRYIEESAEEVGPPNIVTSVLASYRGFDTMGETTVIFTAGMAVLLLLGGPALMAPFRRKGERGEKTASKANLGKEDV
jgi:multicomponent Na+:H+ antiporter subunit B